MADDKSSGAAWTPKEHDALRECLRGVVKPDWNGILAMHGQFGTVNKVLGGRSAKALKAHAYKRNLFVGTRKDDDDADAQDARNLDGDHEDRWALSGNFIKVDNINGKKTYQIGTIKFCTTCYGKKPISQFLALRNDDPTFATCDDCCYDSRKRKREAQAHRTGGAVKDPAVYDFHRPPGIRAFEEQQSEVTPPVPTAATPTSASALPHTPVNHAPVNHTPIKHTPINHTPTNHTPGSHTSVKHTPGSHASAMAPPTTHLNHMSAFPLPNTPLNHTSATAQPDTYDTYGVNMCAPLTRWGAPVDMNTLHERSDDEDDEEGAVEVSTKRPRKW